MQFNTAISRQDDRSDVFLAVPEWDMTPLNYPPRYHTRWRQPFEDRIRERLSSGMTVLDIGAGRRPIIPPDQRPPRATYLGIDISAHELQVAGPAAYDKAFVSDITTPVAELNGTVDLAISWQVLEHVKPLDAALANLHTYLRPGGALISLFSGTWSAFGILNRFLPRAIGHPAVHRVMNRGMVDGPVFRAYYDRCYDRALRKMTSEWGRVEILPLFRGATYFRFSPKLTRAYLAYENATLRRGAANLATHYLLVADRD